MDERRLADLLKEAVSEVPPATFDQRDVARESERQRVRHRNGVLAGSAFGVALMAGIAALGVALWTGPGSPSATVAEGNSPAGGNGTAAPYELPDEDSAGVAPTERGDQQNFPPEMPKQGGYPDGNGGPAGPASTPSGCEQADRELAAALAGELPAAANARVDDVLPVSVVCPTSSRGARYDLSDGRVSAILTAPGVSPPTWALQSGAVRATGTTAENETVVVVSEPDTPGATPPFGDEVSRIALELANEL